MRYLQVEKKPPHGQVYLSFRATTTKEVALPHYHPN